MPMVVVADEMRAQIEGALSAGIDITLSIRMDLWCILSFADYLGLREYDRLSLPLSVMLECHR